MPTQQTAHSNVQNHSDMFKQIYDSALTSAPNELPIKLKNCFIDVRSDKYPYLTVAATLAFEKKHEAVECLRELGASTQQIAIGYALAGNSEKVAAYLERYCLSPSLLAMAYAAGNHQNLAFFYFTASAAMIAGGRAMAGKNPISKESQQSDPVFLNYILYGYAFSGNQHKVEEYLKHVNEVYIPEAVTYALIGYAEANKVDCVENLLNRYDEKYGFRLRPGFIQGYAMAGNHTAVANQLSRVCEEHKSAAIISAAAGYAKAGNHAMVDYYFTQYKDSVPFILTGIVMGYASGGFHNHVYHLLSMKRNEPLKKDQLIDPLYETLVQQAVNSYASVGMKLRVSEMVKQYIFISQQSIAYWYAKTGHLITNDWHIPKDTLAAIYLQTGNLEAAQKISTSSPLGVYKAAIDLQLLISNSQIMFDTSPKTGASIRNVMKRLEGGLASLNPYWMRSDVKLTAITMAIANLPQTPGGLDEAMSNPDSALYRAINMSRITPFTLFGGCLRYGHTKSLITIEENQAQNNLQV